LAVTNISQAGVFGLGALVRAYKRRKMWISEVVTYSSEVVTHSFWFSCFMSGLHKHVGEVKTWDEAMTIDIVHAIQDILHSEWNRTSDLKIKHQIAEMGTWIIGGFCVGLRGEEMLLIEFPGTAKSLKHLLDPKLVPHFVFIVSGPTKGKQLSGPKFGIPCVSITEGTNLSQGFGWIGWSGL
jgi:hypothetical protein